MTEKELLEKLNRQLCYVRQNSRFYTDLPEQSLTSLAQLKDFPCTTAEDLAVRGRDFLYCSAHQVKRMVTMTTSGTTGTPKRLAFTEQDLERTVDFLPGECRPFAGRVNGLRYSCPEARPMDCVIY